MWLCISLTISVSLRPKLKYPRYPVTAILKNLGRVDFALFYFEREPKVPAQGSTASSEPTYCVTL
jgi:hypothetical protein